MCDGAFTYPLIPVMRKIRLPLILVQLTNLSMLLASTVCAACRLPIPIPSHTDKTKSQSISVASAATKYLLEWTIKVALCWRNCCDLSLHFCTVFYENKALLLVQGRGHGPSPCVWVLLMKARASPQPIPPCNEFITSALIKLAVSYEPSISDRGGGDDE